MDAILRPTSELKIDVKDNTKKAMKNSNAALQMGVQGRQEVQYILLQYFLSIYLVQIL